MTEVYFMSRAIRKSDQTTFDKVIRKMDKIADDIQLLNIVTTIFGAVCFLGTWYIIGISILGGF